MDKIILLFSNCYFTDERIIASYVKRQTWILFITSIVFITGIFVPLQKLVYIYIILIWLYMISFSIFLCKQIKFHKETKKNLAEIDNEKAE